MKLEQAIDNKLGPMIDSIVNAAKKIHTDAKAEEYIRRKVADLYYVGKEVGKSCITEELFNEEH
jgi:chromosome condensin MukBEF MukE localization factor